MRSMLDSAKKRKFKAGNNLNKKINSMSALVRKYT